MLHAITHSNLEYLLSSILCVFRVSPGVTEIIAQLQNMTSSEMTSFTLQVAVPKVC